MKKKITIFGSTGSIGRSTLDIIKHNPDKYEVIALTANKNYLRLLEQANLFKPKIVSINDSVSYKKFIDLKFNLSAFSACSASFSGSFALFAAFIQSKQ